MKRRNIVKVLVMMLVLVMVIGSIPASAKKKKVTVSGSKKKIEKAIGKSKSAYITISSDANKVTIPATEGSENKKIVIDCPNADVTNYATFQKVTVKAAKSYTEAAPTNTVVVKNEDAVIKVAKTVSLAIIEVKSESATIIAKKGSTAAVIADKKGADVKIEASKKATVGVALQKTATLEVSGSRKATIGIVNQAEDSTVIANTQVAIQTEQDINIVANEGSEGTILDKTNDAIEANIENNTNDVVIQTINGEYPPVDNPNATSGAIGVEGL